MVTSFYLINCQFIYMYSEPNKANIMWLRFFCFFFVFFLLSWDLTTSQPMWVILCCLPEKGRKEIEEIEEELKERDREERGTGMKVKKQKK